MVTSLAMSELAVVGPSTRVSNFLSARVTWLATKVDITKTLSLQGPASTPGGPPHPLHLYPAR